MGISTSIARINFTDSNSDKILSADKIVADKMREIELLGNVQGEHKLRSNNLDIELSYNWTDTKTQEFPYKLIKLDEVITQGNFFVQAIKLKSYKKFNMDLLSEVKLTESEITTKNSSTSLGQGDLVNWTFKNICEKNYKDYYVISNDTDYVCFRLFNYNNNIIFNDCELELSNNHITFLKGKYVKKVILEYSDKEIELSQDNKTFNFNGIPKSITFITKEEVSNVFNVKIKVRNSNSVLINKTITREVKVEKSGTLD